MMGDFDTNIPRYQEPLFYEPPQFSKFNKTITTIANTLDTLGFHHVKRVATTTLYWTMLIAISVLIWILFAWLPSLLAFGLTLGLLHYAQRLFYLFHQPKNKVL